MPDVNIIEDADVEVSPPGEGASAQGARRAATRAEAAADQTDGDARAVEEGRAQVAANVPISQQAAADAAAQRLLAQQAETAAAISAGNAQALVGVVDNPVTEPSPDVLTDGKGGALQMSSPDGMSVYGAGHAIVGTPSTTSLQTRDGGARVDVDDAQGVDIGGGFQAAIPLAGEGAADGAGGLSHHFAPGAASFAGLNVTQDATGNVAVRNLDGRPVISVAADQGWFTPNELSLRASSAQAASILAREGLDLSRQPLDADINIVVVYPAQSNGAGSQAHPQLTLATTPGTLQLGNGERPAAISTAAWTTKGTPAFNPLVATAIDTDGTTLLSQAAAAALSPTADAYGETIAVAAVSYLRQMQLDATSIAVGARRILLINIGVPGAPIARLARGATAPEFFGQVATALAAVKSVADAAGLTVRVAAAIIAEGEADYGAGTLPATFKAAVGQVVDDMFTYGAAAMLGQTRPFSVFISQTAGGGVIGNGTVAISQALRELASERAWAIVRRVGTSKGLHHDANGARWTATHLGFAMRDELVRRRRFVSVQPIATLSSARGNEVLLAFQAPAPLAVHDYYSVLALVSNVHRGLTVIDSTGTLTVTAVEVVNDYLVRVKVNRLLTGTTVQVDAGRRDVSFGEVGIFSTVQEWVPNRYQFIAGMDPAANIAALVDKPYPAEIPSLLFSITVPMEAV
ncbi:hypothetical protein [Roseococcus sp.]|uniref:hypothetical protein n=1 Tax=Roseococcus sp. TaxID=2109646 RepID=UPI003BAC33E2